MSFKVGDYVYYDGNDKCTQFPAGFGKITQPYADDSDVLLQVGPNGTPGHQTIFDKYLRRLAYPYEVKHKSSLCGEDCSLCDYEREDYLILEDGEKCLDLRCETCGDLNESDDYCGDFHCDICYPDPDPSDDNDCGCDCGCEDNCDDSDEAFGGMLFDDYDCICELCQPSDDELCPPSDDEPDKTTVTITRQPGESFREFVIGSVTFTASWD